MKRLYIPILAVLFALALGALPALSEGKPVNPYREEAIALYEKTLSGGAVMTNAASDVLVEETGSFAYGETITWTITPQDTSDTYEYYLLQLTCSEENGVVLSKKLTDFSNMTVSFEPVAAGQYQVNIWRKFSDSDDYQYLWNASYTLTEDSAHPTAATKAQRVVAEMNAAGITGEWNKALWLHDWLVSNADYDYTYSFYSPQGVLIRGTGVCDSFARAYLMLLEKAGITAQYISNADHAWVAVSLEDEWTLVDVTWDDGVESSDFRSHLYFCVTSDLLELDHPLEHNPSVRCTSLKCNYIVRTDVLKDMIDSLTEDAESLFALHAFSFTANITYIDAEGTKWGGVDVDYALKPIAFLLNQKSWSVRGVSLAGAVSYAVGSKQLTYRMTAEGTIPAPPASGTLVFPDTVSYIGQYAYWGAASITHLVLPESLSTVGYAAFYNLTGLNAVVLPSSFSGELEDFAFPPDCAVLFPAGYTVPSLSWLDRIYQAVR